MPGPAEGSIWPAEDQSRARCQVSPTSYTKVCWPRCSAGRGPPVLLVGPPPSLTSRPRCPLAPLLLLLLLRLLLPLWPPCHSSLYAGQRQWRTGSGSSQRHRSSDKDTNPISIELFSFPSNKNICCYFCHVYLFTQHLAGKVISYSVVMVMEQAYNIALTQT